MMSDVQKVKGMENSYKWKISDFMKKRIHKSSDFYMDELHGNFYAKAFLPNDGSDMCWGIWLKLDPILTPFHYTVSIIDDKGHAFTPRTGKVEGGIFHHRLIMFIRHTFLIEYKLVESDVFTLLFTLDNKTDARQRQDIPSSNNQDGLLEDLSNDFGNFYENKTDTDYMLRVQGSQFPVHRHVLSARSTVFAAMFDHDLSKSLGGELSIPDIDPIALNDALYYIYTGRIRGLSAHTAAAMYTIADKFALTQLKDKCLKFLVNHLTLENVCDAAVLAHKYGERELENKVVQYIGERGEELHKTEKWKEFLQCNIFLECKFLSPPRVFLDKSKD